MNCSKNQDRSRLLNKINENSFTVNDILLYLDTHPTDQEAMNYYHYVKQLNKEAVCAYEQAYGPLMINQVSSDNWSWIKSPWPWEGGNA